MGMIDNSAVGVSACPEGCHWVHRVKGGQPLSVALCSQCGSVNWELLAEDFERAARLRARRAMEDAYGRKDYEDGSHSVGFRGMINIVQVYNLFSKEPGQDGCSMPAPAGTTAQHQAWGAC